MDDPLAILGVYELDSGGRYRRLRSSDTMDGAGYIVWNNEVSSGAAQMYRVLQNTNGELKIKFHPIPVTGLYQVFIISQEVPLVEDDDVVNYPLGWEERIVLGMAKRALTKEESPTSHIDALIREMDQRIEESAWNRLFAANQKVRNVDKVERGWTSLPLIPSREYWYFV